jgi:hypothetical protein
VAATGPDFTFAATGRSLYALEGDLASGKARFLKIDLEDRPPRIQRLTAVEHSLLAGRGSSVYSAVLQDGHTLLARYITPNRLAVIELPSGKVTAQTESDALKEKPGFGTYRRFLAVSPNRAWVAEISDLDNKLQVLNLKTGHWDASLKGDGDATFNHDSTLLAVANGRQLQLWKFTDGTITAAQPDRGREVRYSPNGRLLATVGPELRTTNGTSWQLSVYDATSLSKLAQFVFHAALSNNVTFAWAGDKHIAVSSAGGAANLYSTDPQLWLRQARSLLGY